MNISRHFGVPEPLIFDSPHATRRVTSAVSSAVRTASRDPVMRRWLGARRQRLSRGLRREVHRCETCGRSDCLPCTHGSDVTLAMVGNGPMVQETRAAAHRLGIRATWCGFRQPIHDAVDPCGGRLSWRCRANPKPGGLWSSEALACGTPCVVVRSSLAMPRTRSGPRGTFQARFTRPGDVDGLATRWRGVREATLTRCDDRRILSSAQRRHSSFERGRGGIRPRAPIDVLEASPKREKRDRQKDSYASSRRWGTWFPVFGLERMSFEVLRHCAKTGAAGALCRQLLVDSRVVDLADDVGASWSTGYYWYELRRRATVGAPPASRRGTVVPQRSPSAGRCAAVLSDRCLSGPEFNAIVRRPPPSGSCGDSASASCFGWEMLPNPDGFTGIFGASVIDPCVDQYAPNSRFIEQELLLAHGIAAL